MTKYELHITGECKQNLKLCKKRGLPMQELWDVVAKLLRDEKLDEKYQAPLYGNVVRGSGSVISGWDWLACSWDQTETNLLLICWWI